MPTAVTLKEIEQIFAITDSLGISREALVIPLRPGDVGKVTRIGGGKLEIVVPRDAEFERWLSELDRQLRSLMPQRQD